MDILFWWGLCSAYLFIATVTYNVLDRTLDNYSDRGSAVFFGGVLWFIALPVWAAWRISRD